MTTKKTAVVIALVVLMIAAACDAPEPRRSDAELGLTPVQASGHHIFERQCSSCHAAYSSRNYKGPSLQGMFKKPYLHTGAPANEERVRDIIVLGHDKMPSYARVLTPAQVDEVIEYLHTL